MGSGSSAPPPPKKYIITPPLFRTRVMPKIPFAPPIYQGVGNAEELLHEWYCHPSAKLNASLHLTPETNLDCGARFETGSGVNAGSVLIHWADLPYQAQAEYNSHTNKAAIRGGLISKSGYYGFAHASADSSANPAPAVNLGIGFKNEKVSIGALTDGTAWAEYRTDTLLVGSTWDVTSMYYSVRPVFPQSFAFILRNEKQTREKAAYELSIKGFGHGKYVALGFSQHTTVTRLIHNWFEKRPGATFINNYVDLGFEIIHDLHKHATDFSLGVASQFNKNVLCKAKLGTPGVSLMAAFKNWWQPAVTAALTLSWSPDHNTVKSGLKLRIENWGAGLKYNKPPAGYSSVAFNQN